MHELKDWESEKERANEFKRGSQNVYELIIGRKVIFCDFEQGENIDV